MHVSEYMYSLQVPLQAPFSHRPTVCVHAGPRARAAQPAKSTKAAVTHAAHDEPAAGRDAPRRRRSGALSARGIAGLAIARPACLLVQASRPPAAEFLVEHGLAIWLRRT